MAREINDEMLKNNREDWKRRLYAWIHIWLSA